MGGFCIKLLNFCENTKKLNFTLKISFNIKISHTRQWQWGESSTWTVPKANRCGYGLYRLLVKEYSIKSVSWGQNAHDIYRDDYVLLLSGILLFKIWILSLQLFFFTVYILLIFPISTVFLDLVKSSLYMGVPPTRWN